jgi:hypothetical protein
MTVFREKYKNLRPVIFDVLGPDYETSLLPDGYKLVLHLNPQSMSLSYQRKVVRIQTRGGFVEQHWGDEPQTISFEAVTGGTRRETLAYDSYLDFLSLFHGNGSIYDSNGQVISQGIIKVTFDGGVYLGWFSSFSVTESSDKAFMFSMSAEMTIHKELQVWRTVYNPDQAVNR